MASPGTWPIGAPRAEPECLPSVVLAEVDRLAHVGVGLGDRLAGFEDLERRELDAPRAQDRGRAEEDRRLARPRASPATPATPPRQRRARGRHRPVRRSRCGTRRGRTTRIDRCDLAVGRDDLPVDRGRARRSRAGRSASPSLARTRARAVARRNSAKGSLVNGARRARVGRRAGPVGAGPSRWLLVDGGRRISASSAWPSAKRWRTKLSLDVFSSSRRTR